MWQVAGFAILAARSAARTARCTTVSWRWCRRTSPVSGWTYRRVAGKPTARTTRAQSSDTSVRPPGQLHPPGSFAQVALVKASDALELSVKRVARDRGQERHAVPGRPFPPAPRADWPRRRRPHAQARALEQSQTPAVEQVRHQPERPVKAREDGADLDPREDHRETSRSARAHEVVEPREAQPQHVTVEEEERRERLILRRRAHLAVDGQRRQETADLVRPHLARVPPAVKQDVAADPPDVRLLRPPAMAGPKRLADPTQKRWSPRRIVRPLARQPSPLDGPVDATAGDTPSIGAHQRRRVDPGQEQFSDRAALPSPPSGTPRSPSATSARGRAGRCRSPPPRARRGRRAAHRSGAGR